MYFHFERFATSLVDMWAFYDGESAALGRQWHRTGHAGTSADGGVDNLLGGLIDYAMIVTFKADTNLEAAIFGVLAFSGIFYSFLAR